MIKSLKIASPRNEGIAHPLSVKKNNSCKTGAISLCFLRCSQYKRDCCTKLVVQTHSDQQCRKLSGGPYNGPSLTLERSVDEDGCDLREQTAESIRNLSWSPSKLKTLS